VLTDGRVLVTGGAWAEGPLATAELYSNGSWTAAALLAPSGSSWKPLVSMRAARSSLQGAAVNGLFYAVGGNNGRDTAIVEAYDPASDAWTTVASLNAPNHGGDKGRYQGSAVGVNGKVYMMGGWTNSPPLPSNTLSIYDPSTNTWLPGPVIPGSGFTACSEAAVIGSKIYLLNACNGFSGYVQQLSIFDTNTNKWTTGKNAPRNHNGGLGTALNGKFYVTGGNDGNYQPQVDVYDPATNMWTTVGSMPVNLASMAGDVINGKWYIVGGSDPTTNFENTLWIYDPATNTKPWTSGPAAPTARNSATAVTINGKLYVVGGSNSTGFLSTLEVFDPNSCQVDVQRSGQCTGVPGFWGRAQYAFHDLTDHDGFSICRWGCNMSSLSMALQSERVLKISDCLPPGIGAVGGPVDDSFVVDPHTCALGPAVDNNPGSLNAFMRSFSLYDQNNNTKYLPTTMIVGNTVGKRLVFVPREIDSAPKPDEARRFLDDTICAGHAVIVGVKFCEPIKSPNTPCHFVLAYGKQGDNYLIRDPAALSVDPNHFDNSPRETLLFNSLYDSRFVTRGYVVDPPDDRSGLALYVGTNVDLLLTDPSGRKTGLDVATGEVLDQIPTSAHFSDAIENDVTGSPPTGISHSVEVLQPAGGTQQVLVTGLELGIFMLEVDAFSQDGSPQPPVSIQGIASPGSSSSFQIEFDPTPGATLRIVRVASFKSTADDIRNGFQIGLIDNRGVANSLSQKIEAAADAAARGQKQTARNILGAFKNEVSAQSGKHVMGIAVQVLLEDVDWLISQLP
jgi:N-acetylneuraminic acid mutarotase